MDHNNKFRMPTTPSSMGHDNPFVANVASKLAPSSQHRNLDPTLDLVTLLENARVGEIDRRNKPLPSLPAPGSATTRYLDRLPRPHSYLDRLPGPRPLANSQDSIGSSSSLSTPPRLPPRPQSHSSGPFYQQPRPYPLEKRHGSSISNTPISHPPCMLPGVIPFESKGKACFPWELVPSRKENWNDQENADKAIAVNEKRTLQGKATPPPTTPLRKQREKTPLSSLPTPAKGQCWGIKQDGTRCTRKVKHPGGRSQSRVKDSPAKSNKSTPSRKDKRKTTKSDVIVITDSEGSDDDESFPTLIRHTSPLKSRAEGRQNRDDDDQVYCFQHVAEVNKNPGFYTHVQTSQTFVRFSDYITSTELSDHTQALLRKCMSQSPSEVDRQEQGYIYIYELRDRSDAEHVCLKVGRTVNVFRRINQWRTQCQSQDPVLRAFLPCNQKHQGMLSGADTINVTGLRLSHKWERLVHLELQDIGQRVQEECNDCRSKHREIFMIPKVIPWKTTAGFELTREIVNKWMEFIRLIMTDE